MDSRPSSNFFGGYVPEGRHRELVAARGRFDQNDLFAWLSRYGLTMAGALSFRHPDRLDDTAGGYRKLTRRELIEKLESEQRNYNLDSNRIPGGACSRGSSRSS